MITLRRFWAEAPATVLFTALAVIVYLITAAESLSLMNNLHDSALGRAWVLYGPEVSSGGWDRLRALGAVFLHIDLGHVAINSFLLMLVGREIEKFAGTALYAAAFLAGGIGASATVLWMDWAQPTAGASGALFALMMLLVGVARVRGGDLRAPLTLVAVNVAYTFVAPSVSLWGHLGGLFAGAVMVWFFVHREHRVRWAGVLAVLAASCAAVLVV
ncbi:MAG: rhomboid family intramembrane serine protease [Corynebacterium sp.]|uniref:rhomboid family intramembrane serine protease n=1 Tax=Corynebacterium sp. TaxID=1720 RepID=UPI0026DFBB78|nr:rhomboid family intramembrane serine protease [Corynebacterium sp.]MDO5669920.1 rhomboid family intramembrane serine protease [Corynebacterium sp.]